MPGDISAFLYVLVAIAAVISVAALSEDIEGTCDQSCSFDKEKPNFIVFLADDLGFGDLSVYGHPTQRTPNIDDLANNGVKFNSFYSGASICSPSRGSLLTGQYHVRLGIYPSLFNPASTKGLIDVPTIGSVLKPAGYKSALIGKWHLGVGANNEYLPLQRGFDYYWGMPYSNGMCMTKTGNQTYCFYPNVDCEFEETRLPPCPIYRNNDIIEQPANYLTWTSQLVDEAKQYITGSGEDPFFMLVSFLHPHRPSFAGKQFTNSSIRGKYGDSVNELDWAVGEIMHELRQSGKEKNTFVIFTSDNGPDVNDPLVGGMGGVAGPLRCGKHSEFEGGRRVPGIAYWKNKIRPRTEFEHMATFMDILPTLANLAGVEPPVTDGVDLGPLIFKGREVRQSLHYFSGFENGELFAVRHKQFKAHYFSHGHQMACGQNWTSGAEDNYCCLETLAEYSNPLVYNLAEDPGERQDLYSTLAATEEGQAILASLKEVYTEGNRIEKHPSVTEDINPNSPLPEPLNNRFINPTVMPCCTNSCSVFSAYPACITSCRCDLRVAAA